MKYYTIDKPKQLRETLCVAQALIGNSYLNTALKKTHMARLQRLIDDCDCMRPLGPDGKHGDMHTDMCGCEEDHGRTVPPPSKGGQQLRNEQTWGK